MAHSPNGAKSVGPHAIRTDSDGSTALSHSLFPKNVLTLPTDFSELHSLIGLEDPDRKSTRLNSSHSQISYAVFCLKKKQLSHIHHSTLQLLIHTLRRRLCTCCAH